MLCRPGQQAIAQELEIFFFGCTDDQFFVRAFSFGGKGFPKPNNHKAKQDSQNKSCCRQSIDVWHCLGCRAWQWLRLWGRGLRCGLGCRLWQRLTAWSADNLDVHGRQRSLFHCLGLNIKPINANLRQSDIPDLRGNIDIGDFFQSDNFAVFHPHFRERLFRILLKPRYGFKFKFRQLAVNHAGSLQINGAVNGFSELKLRFGRIELGMELDIFCRQPPVAAVFRRSRQHIDFDGFGSESNRISGGKNIAHAKTGNKQIIIKKLGKGIIAALFC